MQTTSSCDLHAYWENLTVPYPFIERQLAEIAINNNLCERANVHMHCSVWSRVSVHSRNTRNIREKQEKLLHLLYARTYPSSCANLLKSRNDSWNGMNVWIHQPKNQFAIQVARFSKIIGLPNSNRIELPRPLAHWNSASTLVPNQCNII